MCRLVIMAPEAMTAPDAVAPAPPPAMAPVAGTMNAMRAGSAITASTIMITPSTKLVKSSPVVFHVWPWMSLIATA